MLGPMSVPIEDYRALRKGAATIDLSAWCVLRMTGADTREFLQGTATQDLAAPAPPIDATTSWAYQTLFLNEKGRPVALAWVTIAASGSEAWVLADEGARAALRPHFERFRIMEDVEFEGPDGTPLLIGVAGPDRAAMLSQLDKRVPDSVAIHAEPLSFLLARSGTISTDPSLPPFAHPDAVEAWRLAVGLPRTGVDFDTDRIATELNLPDAISSTKGCYVGQEVVARTSNRGQVRRRRVGLRFPWPGNQPAPKSELRFGDSAAGFLTSAAPEPGSTFGLGMGYLTTETAGSTSAVLTKGAAPTPLSVQDWPL